ncbi:hypothetical protein [Anaerobium acetethylicum]|uniref:Phage integrase, N-terminal SAM-like domain n=1 Tax=Anaerobium acetethylicum TaxID=1619234 RepID=A0A1D3TPE3_9FIRM|nr:hypothetical protein [Anaerobium acetethylicum]SCP95232.1 hypothetical protein SAMN05421730_1001411 [Anaerobium acetethylicum]
MFNEDVLKEFLLYCKLRKISERTMKGYRIFKHAVAIFLKGKSVLSDCNSLMGEAVCGIVGN